jgi:hypothetical protein
MQARGVGRTALAVAAVVVMSGTTAAPATAKAVSKLEACGPSACRETADEQTLRLLTTIGDPQPASPPRQQRARWYRMIMTVTWDTGPGEQGHDSWRMRYYPAAGMVRDHRVWVKLPGATIAKFNDLTRGLIAHGAVPSAPGGSPAVVIEPAATTPAGDGTGMAAAAAAGALTAGVIGGVVVLHRRGRHRTASTPLN